MPRCPALRAATVVALIALGGGSVDAEPVQAPPSRLPSARIEDLQGMMSPHCARMVESIRSRSAERSARNEEFAALLREYRARCLDEHAAAHKRWSERQQREIEQRRAADDAKRVERERAALHDQQCAELLRILRGRRERAAAMNEGERADLVRFEQVFRERCVRG